MNESHFDLNNLSHVLRDYLKGVTDRTERNLLKRFKEFMAKNHYGIKVKDVRHNHFENFLKSLSPSEQSLPSYRSRLNRFKKHIGLSQTKVKRSRKSRNEKCGHCGILERKLAEKDDVIIRHRETIDEKDVTIKEKDRIIDRLKSKGMEIEELEHLETKKTELEKEIAEREEIITRQSIIKVVCPKNGLVVSFGNDCHECSDYINCSAYGKLLYPEEE